MRDTIMVVAVAVFVIVSAFLLDEPKDCRNVWTSLQHKVMSKECPR